MADIDVLRFLQAEVESSEDPVQQHQELNATNTLTLIHAFVAYLLSRGHDVRLARDHPLLALFSGDSNTNSNKDKNSSSSNSNKDKINSSSNSNHELLHVITRVLRGQVSSDALHIASYVAQQSALTVENALSSQTAPYALNLGRWSQAFAPDEHHSTLLVIASVITRMQEMDDHVSAAAATNTVHPVPDHPGAVLEAEGAEKKMPSVVPKEEPSAVPEEPSITMFGTGDGEFVGPPENRTGTEAVAVEQKQAKQPTEAKEAKEAKQPKSPRIVVPAEGSPKMTSPSPASSRGDNEGSEEAVVLAPAVPKVSQAAPFDHVVPPALFKDAGLQLGTSLRRGILHLINGHSSTDEPNAVANAHIASAVSMYVYFLKSRMTHCWSDDHNQFLLTATLDRFRTCIRQVNSNQASIVLPAIKSGNCEIEAMDSMCFPLLFENTMRKLQALLVSV